MGSYRRIGKFVFDSFQSCSWRRSIMPKTQFFLSNKRFSQFEQLLFPSWKTSKFHTGITSHSLVSQRLSLRNRVNRNLCNPLLNEARRFYYADQHNNLYKPSKSRRLRRWFPAGVLIGSCCIGVILKTYYDHLENVPLQGRTRLILVSQHKLRRISEMSFKENKEILESETLPDTHIESIRVRRIAQDLFDALHRQSEELGISQFDGLDWEVFVVKGFGDVIGMEYGKIVLFDWVLEHVTSDAEIAFLIAREIGPIVARHVAEIMTVHYCHKFLKPILDSMGLWDTLMKRYDASVSVALSKHEYEADYIGLYLSASAGYDPRAAPKILERIGKVCGKNSTSHRPSPNRRAKYLSTGEIMEVPLAIYLRGCLNINA